LRGRAGLSPDFLEAAHAREQLLGDQERPAVAYDILWARPRTKWLVSSGVFYRLHHVFFITLVTKRFAMELGYHVTLVRDATAAFTPEMMHAAHELNGPTYAQSILTTAEVIAALPTASRSPEIVK
jgi:Isochorismatase family